MYLLHYNNYDILSSFLKFFKNNFINDERLLFIIKQVFYDEKI